MTTNQDNTLLNSGEETSNEDFSIIEFLSRYLRYWKWLVLGVLVALIIGFLYVRYSTPVYDISGSIILKDVRDARMEAMTNALPGFAMNNTVSNLDNEIYIIKSRNIIGKVINRLDLHTSYIVEGRIKDTDLYDKTPIKVDMEQSKLDSLKENINFTMQMTDDSSARIIGTIADSINIDTVITSFPALIYTPVGNISFTRNDEISNISKLNITIQHPDDVIKEYLGNLSIEPASRTATVLNIHLKTPYPNKGKDFIRTLVEVYNNETIEDKNLEALNTKRFIDERIAIINEELSEADQDVERFKRSEGLTDIQTDLQRDMQMASQYERQLVDVSTQLDMINSLNEYINNPDNANSTIPGNIGINDPTLAATTNEYNKMLLDRQRLAQTMTDDNPNMKILDEQIATLRSSINASINSVQQSLNIQKRDARNQANLFGGRLGSNPTQERQFLELSREQQIKANLFLMLLEKREENALSLATYANKAKVLNEPALVGKVAPRTAIILLAAFILGLLIPAAIIYLLDIIQYRIRTRSDVDKISKVPVLGEVPNNKENTNIAVKDNGDSEVDEAFRIMRTNLVLTLGSDNKVVIFTSTVPGEGKSFVALNTAISLALLNKKVLLIGMDLRIPRVKDYMQLKTNDGLTNYLSGLEKNINNLIVPSDIHPMLYALPAGPIPPNPAELLTRHTLDTAIEKLREEFDYILIDSAPVSQVTDTLIIRRISDATVYVARANYSSKGNLKFANQLMAQNKLNNMLLVINDVSDFHKYGHRNGYGYGYGYKKGRKKK